MSATLKQLLNEKQTAINKTVALAEEHSGYPSEDVRLLADLAATSRRVLRRLNLDPHDTRAAELYHALLVEYEKSSQTFAGQIREKDDDSLNKRLKRATEAMNHAMPEMSVWVLKKNIAKGLLKNHQPKRLMKELSYRSVDSMLKRENISLLWAALPHTQSSRWLQLMRKKQAKLSLNDFETRPAELIVPTAARWSGITARNSLLSSVDELGAVVFWPNAHAGRTTSLGLAALGLQSVDRLRCRSAWFKLQRFSPGLGKRFAESLKDKSTALVKINGALTIPWSAVQRFLARRERQELPAELELYLDRSDLSQRTPVELLFALVPQLHAWTTCQYLLFSDSDGQAVSTNLVDIAVSHATKKSLAERFGAIGKQTLQEALISRYLAHPSFETYVLRALEHNLFGHDSDFEETGNFSKLGTNINRRARTA